MTPQGTFLGYYAHFCVPIQSLFSLFPDPEDILKVFRFNNEGFMEWGSMRIIVSPCTKWHGCCLNTSKICWGLTYISVASLCSYVAGRTRCIPAQLPSYLLTYTMGMINCINISVVILIFESVRPIIVVRTVLIVIT